MKSNTSDERLKERLENYFAEEPDEALRAQISLSTGLDLSDRMANYVRFGTAGLRGRMEAGYNRMNIPVVYRLAHAVGSLFSLAPIVVAYDGRQKSAFFAQEIATVLSRLGSRVDIFKEPVPTPLCAFATKYLKARIGVIVTASHNPAYDNGIKLFDNNSAQAHGQILYDLENYMAQAPLRPDFYAQHSKKHDLNILGDEIFSAYAEAIKKTKLFDDQDLDKSVDIAYTALHGVGQKFFLKIAREENFNNIQPVKEQAEPDGSFPTVLFPNPEEEHTLDQAHALARKNNLEWVFANDPDADRLQVSCKSLRGDMLKLSGNEMGSILGFFAIERALRLKEKPLVASSIVSSRMLQTIARDMKALYVDALTGFSNIAHKALSVQKITHSNFVFAYEEAIGFLVGDVILDKDGINTGVRFLEIAAWLKKQHKTIWQFLDELYVRFGLFKSEQWSLRFEGPLSFDTMQALMLRVRKLNFKELYENLNFYDLNSEAFEGPYAGLRSNVVIFEKENNFRLIIRPSGTEPKIKFYMELCEPVANLAELSSKKIRLAKRLGEMRSLVQQILS